MSTKSYFLPQSIEDATNLLADEGPELMVLAGGTLAMPLINEGVSTPEQVMGLRKVGLDYMRKSNGYYAIGAMTTLTQMVNQEEIPILRKAAQAVGGWAIRNMGTIGGNLFAPPPGGDFAVALLALEAQLVLTSKMGERIISATDFFTGFMTNVLQQGEIVTEIRIPNPIGRTAYYKFGRRKANTPSIVSVAVNLVFENETVKEARIALNAVGPFPFRAVKTEKFLIGKELDEELSSETAGIAVEECEPFTDPIASEWYRRKMVPVIVKRTLAKITG